MNSFIKRSFQNIQTNENLQFDTLVLKTSIISVILGEPASGKTYQLKEYNKSNPNTQFISLVTLKEDDNISSDTEIVLIDSIDEALTQNNQKILSRNLKEYIVRCRQTNPDVKFIISCRFLEWNKYFKSELQNIDNELKEYEILPLSHEDINSLLDAKGIDKDNFWNFIDSNHLEPLLKNILIILHLIDNFNDYSKREVSFINIYQDLVKKYLSEQGEDRVETKSLSLDRLVSIASSLATYMLLNRKDSVDITNKIFLASELYKIDKSDITESDISAVLNTALFEKKGNTFSFFHKSIQEYLMAHFIAYKDLDTQTIKKIFASKLRFYEEFEEVIVYLTNIKPELFDEFVKFDPFIFKRHPSLSKEQQETLLKSILDKFEKDEVQAWGRWKSFDDSTLVKFDKLDNLVDILEEHYTGSNANYYLMNLFKNNYTKEFQDFIFNIFRQKLNDKNSLRELIRRNFIDNYAFNVELYDFMKANDLFIKDEHILFMSFEAELFCSLYGIKYKHKYGFERVVERTDYDFEKLLDLLQYIPPKMLEYIAPYLTKEDAHTWFKNLKETHNKQEHNHEYVLWILYAVLNHYSQKEDLIEVVNFVKNNHIYLHSYDKEKMQFDFQIIANDFWELYFENDLFDEVYHHNNIVLALYNITLEDIQKASEKYPIKDNLEKYVLFRVLENVDDFLKQDNDFKQHMENILAQQSEQQRRMDEEFRKKYPESFDREKKEKEFLEECIDRFDTEDEKESDLYDIFLFALNKYHGNIDELNKYLKDLLKSNYGIFVEKIIEVFQTDTTYQKLKKELTSTSLSNNNAFMFQYLFGTLDDKNIDNLIKTKKDYIKLFWHTYRFSLNAMDDYFIKLSDRYFECFKLLTLHTLKLSLKQSENKKIGNFHLLVDVYKKLNKFDIQNLSEINKFLKENKEILISIEEYREKEILLDIIILNKKNFDFILELINKDEPNMQIYLQYLLQMDTQRALKEFISIYENEKTYKPWWVRLKNKPIDKKIAENNYDKFEINPKKIQLYQNLLLAVKKSKIDFDDLKSSHLKILLKDYYEYFLPYQIPEGVHSVGIYENMYFFMRNLWMYLQNTTKHIDLLDELSKDTSPTISKQAKYALTKVYELQEKDRNYPNSYYKNIFDKEKNMGNNTINIKGDRNQVVVDSKNVTQTNISKSEEKKDRWWVYSSLAGLITAVMIWWSFDLCYYVIGGGIISFLIVWKLNPKFRFRNIGYALLASGILSNIIPFSGIITIPKNDIIHGFIEIGDNNYSWLLILLSIPFFILDYFENKK